MVDRSSQIKPYLKLSMGTEGIVLSAGTKWSMNQKEIANWKITFFFGSWLYLELLSARLNLRLSYYHHPISKLFVKVKLPYQSFQTALMIDQVAILAFFWVCSFKTYDLENRDFNTCNLKIRFLSAVKRLALFILNLYIF
jgi:hypothetical protein